MPEKITVLLVHHNSETLIALKATLERLGVRVTQAESRAQAKRMLGGLHPAPLVFTDTHLPDGTWADVLAAARGAALPVNVIVVSRVVNTRFYVEAIETGAFDFVAPPFNATELAHVVRCASANVITQRNALPPIGPPAEGGVFAQIPEIGTEAISS